LSEPLDGRYARAVVRIAVTFRYEDEADGEPIGPILLYDEDEPEYSWVGHLVDSAGRPSGWCKLSDARRWAESRGYVFYEDGIY
jgi:hypothetical protein